MITHTVFGTLQCLCLNLPTDTLAGMHKHDKHDPTNSATPTQNVHPLRDRCPSLSPEGLEQAEDNLHEYIALALRVYERIRNDTVAYEQFRALTAKDKNDTIHSQQEKLPDDSPPHL